ncbi:MAG TPA: phosphoribosyl-ATP diphosphatase [Holophaga sp.]|nr:phosphoribosyl-ATP diphosphatase [Holophaga sp.]
MLIPSIDLMDGKAVQLVGGREKVLEVEDVLGLARRWRPYGELAVIDLDAALGRGGNLDLVKALCREARCRVGGGIRTPERAFELLRAGAASVILGTAASEELLAKLPRERTLVAVDQRQGRLQVKGWTEDAAESPLDRMRRLAPLCGGFLATVVDKEGRLAGVDWEAAKAFREATDRPVVYAGGVSTAEDVAALDRLGLDAQVGMALYQGLMDPGEAYAACLDWDKQGGLLPVAVQDEAGRLLMVAYTDRATLVEALARGRGIYWSRSRQARWEKGATSGHTQVLLRATADCDRDTLRFLVRQEGPACHTGRATCFGEADFALEDLESTLRERAQDPVAGSYTARLFREEGLLAAKLAEEAVEVAEAGTADELVWEGADLLYFLMVRLAQGGVRMEQVLRELERRRKTDTRKPGNAKGVRPC